MNPNGNLANLRPWGPENPPPKSPGRPPKRPQSEANEELLRRTAPQEVAVALRNLGLPEEATVADVLALCLFREGLKGNVNAIKELRESVEGKSMQRIELTSSPEDRGFEVRVSYAEALPPRIIDMVVSDAVLEAVEEREREEESATVAAEEKSNGDRPEGS